MASGLETRVGEDGVDVEDEGWKGDGSTGHKTRARSPKYTRPYPFSPKPNTQIIRAGNKTYT
jgi:hypothetical protein